MKYTLEKRAGLRWRITCPDKSYLDTSSLTEALEFMRKHITSELAFVDWDAKTTKELLK